MLRKTFWNILHAIVFELDSFCVLVPIVLRTAIISGFTSECVDSSRHPNFLPVRELFIPVFNLTRTAILGTESFRRLYL